MDVRGPTRAAMKRLTIGMVVACAAAAVGAPVVRAATVSSSNPGGVATYVPEAGDVGHHLVLGPDPNDATQLLFNDTIRLNPVVGGDALGDPETCFAAGAGSQTATCPVDSPVAVTLGPGDDALELKGGVNNANVDASTGND